MEVASFLWYLSYVLRFGKVVARNEAVGFLGGGGLEWKGEK